MPPSNDNIILKLYFTAKLQRALTRGTVLWSLCRDKNIYINIYSTLTYTTLNPWATFLKSHPTGLQSFDWQQPLTLWKYKFWASRTKLIFSVSSGTILQYLWYTNLFKLQCNWEQILRRNEHTPNLQNSARFDLKIKFWTTPRKGSIKLIFLKFLKTSSFGWLPQNGCESWRVYILLSTVLHYSRSIKLFFAQCRTPSKASYLFSRRSRIFPPKFQHKIYSVRMFQHI